MYADVLVLFFFCTIGRKEKLERWRKGESEGEKKERRKEGDLIGINKGNKGLILLDISGRYLNDIK